MIKLCGFSFLFSIFAKEKLRLVVWDKGYAINQHFERIEERVANTERQIFLSRKKIVPLQKIRPHEIPTPSFFRKASV